MPLLLVQHSNSAAAMAIKIVIKSIKRTHLAVTTGASLLALGTGFVTVTDSAEPPDLIDALTITRDRVLIVDEDPDITALLAGHLALLKIVCDLAGSDVEALAQQISVKSSDAMFTDTRITGMDGLSVCKQLQIGAHALANKVAFATGDVVHINAAKIVAVGNYQVIKKTFNFLQERKLALLFLFTRDKT